MGLKTMIRNEVMAGKGFRDLETYELFIKTETGGSAAMHDQTVF